MASGETAVADLRRVMAGMCVWHMTMLATRVVGMLGLAMRH
jgi:hypothetical protein